MRPIYLDYNASTPVDPRVVEAMLPYFSDVYANASSTDHGAGHAARQAVEAARAEVANLIGAAPEEIVFTSGATEADNLAVLGLMARAAPDAELVVSSIEHPAVLEPARQFGDRLKLVPVDADGVVDPDELARLLSPRTALVSVMAANNETGVVQPVREIGRICAEAEVPFHCDAVQAGARLPIDVGDWNVALLSLSAHKMYGPKGVGLLYVRRRPRVKIHSILFGGGHERNLRPGTLNVPAIVAFGVAARLAAAEREADCARLSELRTRLLARLESAGATASSSASVLPQTLNLRLPGVAAQALMRRLSEGFAFSAGAACATTKVEPSHVLLAQGLDERAISESVRFSFGRFTTAAELERAADAVVAAAADLRALTAAAV